jgi:beta-lactamase class D
LHRLFTERGVEGAFVLQELGGNELVVNPALADVGFPPASTFKIPNTLIGLETSVIPDEKFVLKWDGKDKGREPWNRDHDLASAIQNSVLWYYQEVARRVGVERMKKLVDGFDYGNEEIGGAGEIDRFWLNGPLLITPREQVAFLGRLVEGKLPVSARNRAILSRIIVLDDRPGWKLRGKTGMTFMDRQTIGWLVGWLEKDGRTYLYATFVRGKGEDAQRIIPLRRELTEALLARIVQP